MKSFTYAALLLVMLGVVVDRTHFSIGPIFDIHTPHRNFIAALLPQLNQRLYSVKHTLLRIAVYRNLIFNG